MILTALTVGGVCIATLEARAIWHYAISPPSLKDQTGPWTKVVAVSQVELTPGAIQRITRSEMLERSRFCQEPDARCANRTWTLMRAVAAGMNEVTPEIADDVLSLVVNDQLKRLQKAEWRVGGWKSVRLAGGLAVQFESGRQKWVLLEYSSYRGMDNRFVQVEALYELLSGQASLAADVYYFFDNDRLPQLWLSVLSEVNIVVLFVGASLVYATRAATGSVSRLACVAVSLLTIGVISYFSYAAIERFDAAFIRIKIAFIVGAVIGSVLPIVSLYGVFRAIGNRAASNLRARA